MSRTIADSASVVVVWRSASARSPGCGSTRRASRAADCRRLRLRSGEVPEDRSRADPLPAEGRDSGRRCARPGRWPSGPRTGSSWPATRPIRVFAPDGKKLKDIELDQEPYCLAVGNAEHAFPGRLYVGMRDHVEVYDADGKRRVGLGPAARQTDRADLDRRWPTRTCSSPTPARWWSGITTQRQSARADRQARPVAGHSAASSCPARISTWPSLPTDCCAWRIPGMHRIEAYTFDGHLELSWGKRGMGIEAFCGCCNPSNIAILPDGRVVTAEKGIPRVKVYSADGRVRVRRGRAGTSWPRTARRPSRLATSSRLHPVDLAVDSRARILVLDPAAGCVRIFEHK